MDDDNRIGYLQRSYAAVDGLWFMMVEEAFGFDKALELDKKVWEIMPRIQSRFLKPIIDDNDPLTGLLKAFTEKLTMDGSEFDTTVQQQGFDVRIKRCPWHDTMVRSGREHLSSIIGNTICTAEYAGWAKEAGQDISASIGSRICCGDETCLVRFQIDRTK